MTEKQMIAKAKRIWERLQKQGKTPPPCYQFCRCDDDCEKCAWSWPCWYDTLTLHHNLAVLDAVLDGVL